MGLAPRAVVVHRRTEYEELVSRHGTAQQADFFLKARGRSIDEVLSHHDAVHRSLTAVANAIPADWRRGQVERSDLDRFRFDPGDIVIAIGQDGLVANVAKYLDRQPVIGVNAEPGINPGMLVPHVAETVAPLLVAVVAGEATSTARTMVRATTDDGQHLDALNEIYLGHPSHQSARYLITAADGTEELQSSSGILCGTGTGATGWCRSAWLERHSNLALPAPTAPALVWFVREAWPSPITGTNLTDGALVEPQSLTVTSQHDNLVIFGDGIESDAIHLTWGQRATLRIADRQLMLVTG